MAYPEKNLSQQPQPTLNITSGIRAQATLAKGKCSHQFVTYTWNCSMPKSAKALVYELVQGLIKVPKAHIREPIVILD